MGIVGPIGSLVLKRLRICRSIYQMWRHWTSWRRLQSTTAILLAMRNQKSKCRRDRFQVSMQFDQEHDFSRLSYRIMKVKKTPQLQDVPVKLSTGARLLRSSVGATAFQLDDMIEIPKHATLEFNEAKLQFVQQQGRKVFFRHLSGKLDPNGTLTVHFHAVTEQEKLKEFNQFWIPYWQRDDKSEQFSSESWSDFMTLLDTTTVPRLPSNSFDIDDIDVWYRLVGQLPANKAVGPCGWSNDELKCPPRICTADLVKIFNLVLQYGFSPSTMMAKTILLSKSITSSIHARCKTGYHLKLSLQALWKDDFQKMDCLFFPGGLRWDPSQDGELKRSHSCRNKRSIEDALHDGQTCGGYSLDLIKAFNTFGRFAVGHMMLHLGIPNAIINAWILRLDRMIRYPTLNCVVGNAVASTTGVPEGYSISVLAMLATSFFYYHQLCHHHVTPFAYADNWSWLTQTQRSHFQAHVEVCRFTEILRLKIDHAKSWHWGTTKTFRKACIDHFSGGQTEA